MSQIRTVIGMLLILAMLCFVVAALSSKAQADENVCQKMALLTTEAAKQRDAGMSKEEWLSKIRPAIVDSESPKYAAAVAYVVSAQAWTFPYQTPGEEGNSVYNLCKKEGW